MFVIGGRPGRHQPQVHHKRNLEVDRGTKGQSGKKKPLGKGDRAPSENVAWGGNGGSNRERNYHKGEGGRGL